MLASTFKLMRTLQISRETDVRTSAYVNRDTRPLPPSRRTYGPWHFVGLWTVTGSFNVGGWATGSSLLGLGLNVWQAMITVIIGHTLVGVICVLSGGPGAQWHIGFPILQRASWGCYGAIFPLVQRILLSFIWASCQVWWGGLCVKCLLTSLFPSYRHLNTALAGGTMTSGDLIGFLIFLIICLPIIWIPPEKYKPFFMAAAVSVIPTVFALLGWCVNKAGGGGAMLTDTSVVTGTSQAHGSRLAWMLIFGICSNIGGIATHIFSQSDFTRFARRPGDQLLSQILFVPLNTIFVAFVGIVCTSCAVDVFFPGEATTGRATLLWEPYALLEQIQVYYHDSIRSRVAVAFASLAFILAQLGITVAENCLSNGIDLSALLPQVFNLRRGGYLTAIFSLVMQPWQLLNGANKFVTVMGGYGVFLGAMSGVMFCDYYHLRRRQLKLTALFDLSPASIYWYDNGFNYRAFLSWTLAISFLLPGFCWHVQNPNIDHAGWTKLYYMAWPLGCTLSYVLFYLLNSFHPIQNMRDTDGEDHFGTFEEKIVAQTQREESEQADVETPHAPRTDDAEAKEPDAENKYDHAKSNIVRTVLIKSKRMGRF